MEPIRYSFEKVQFPDVVAATREHLTKIALLDVDPLQGEQLLSVGMEVRLLPGVAVGRLWCSPGHASRTSAHIADGNDNVMLVLPVDTGMLVRRRGQAETLCRPGDAFVLACDEPVSFTYHQHCTTLNISLPRTALAALDPSARSRLMTLIEGKAAPDLWLLRNYAAMLVAGDPLLPETEHLAAAHLQDLAALLLGAGSGRAAERAEGVQAVRLRAIRADIAANISRPISAEAMARRHAISPRYLRALFAAAGTSYTDTVMACRLGHARRLLSDPRLAHLNLTAIAYRCGFADLAYFSRVFRRHFGMSPSAARAGLHEQQEGPG